MARSRRLRSYSTRKLWAFRLLAVLLGIAPFACIEVGLRATSVGLPSEAVDPYVGFDAIHPLFVRGDDRQTYVTDPARRAYFRPDTFAADKPANGYRIFCLGGSTVQGRPYAIETSFATWLKLGLEVADPSRDWEVVNCGGISYASYRLVPIIRELSQYEPDLFVIYTGHNEFLEDRTYRLIKETPAAVAALHARFSQFRLYNLSRSGWNRLRNQQPVPTAGPQTILPSEVDALLDYNGGLADYHRDDDWRRGATEHYELNLRTIIGAARNVGVPVVLVNPVLNLRDCPPFKSAPRDDISADEAQEFAALWERAQRSEHLSERIELLERAVSIDGRHAAAHYALAKSYDASGDYEAAKASYLRAKEEDICPLRMIEAQYAVLARVAQEVGVPLVDARAFFESKSRVGIPGDDWLLDHVHPSLNGHQEIAGLLIDQMVQMRILTLRDGWESDRRTRYSSHLDELPAAYFVHGAQRLEGLIRWTKGRAEDSSKNRRRRGRRKQEPSPPNIPAAAVP